MEENLEISKSKFFLSLSLSLSPKRKRNAETLSLFSLSLSLFTFLKCLSFVQRRCVLRARTERERERERERGYDVLEACRLSLYKVCLSRRRGSLCWIFEKVTNFFI